MRAGSLCAGDAYSQECAGGADRTRPAGPQASTARYPPPSPPQCGPADPSSLRPRLPPMPFPPDPYCIMIRQPGRLRAALFAFDLSVQLNYWRPSELFSRVWGSRPGYRIPTRPPSYLAHSGQGGPGTLWRGGGGRLSARGYSEFRLSLTRWGRGHRLESGWGSWHPLLLCALQGGEGVRFPTRMLPLEEEPPMRRLE